MRDEGWEDLVSLRGALNAYLSDFVHFWQGSDYGGRSTVDTAVDVEAEERCDNASDGDDSAKGMDGAKVDVSGTSNFLDIVNHPRPAQPNHSSPAKFP